MNLSQSKFHFVGVGGIGMCGLAELLHNIGAQVSGSDLGENANTERLKELGIVIYKGHARENLKDADVVVYSSAVHFENPELVEARRLKIPIIPRAEALAELMRMKRGIAVAGTHGKTTTTSLVSSIFLEAKLAPTIVVGGRLDLIKSTALLGQGEWLIAEADESDGSFSKLNPEIAIITNIDNDHLDHYQNFANLQKAFVDFANKIPFYGKVIVCGDDAKVFQLFQNFSKRILFYGFAPHNDWILSGSGRSYQIYVGSDHAAIHNRNKGDLLTSFELPIPGRHNALNATAALAAADAAGVDFSDARAGLMKFSGVDRRFHYKGETNGVLIYDDYGHHPTEVAATLQAFKEQFPDRRLVVLFQPHRYSRTKICWNEFMSCFDDADVLYVTDIYAAGEAAIDGVDSARLALEMKHKNCQYIVKDTTTARELHRILKPGDVFLTLGAGDGWKIGLDLLKM